MSAEDAPRRQFLTANEDRDRPVADFLVRHCPEAPVGFLKKLLRKGFVSVHGKAADERTRLQPRQRVTLSLPEGAFLVAPNAEVPFRVLFEDEALAVIDKPAGVVSEPGIGHKLDTLLNGLIARYGEAQDRIGPDHDFGLVHRLDRDTSGLMLVARGAEMQEKLSAQFRGRRVEKQYVALAVGHLPREKGEIRLPLGRIRVRGRAVAVTSGPTAQPALTSYRVLERFPSATLVQAAPHTGRWRQIRLHFQAEGYPVAGDPDEGDAKANESLAASAGLQRMFLHAQSLKFTHPLTGEAMAFTLPLPEELERVLKRLRAEDRGARNSAPKP